ncbi:hypothetical protein ACFYNF_32900 [Streptomyces sp. NPDC006641]|uniref:hypothetical protein n=1 Tax=unclassified Streptomyces TaxID=2593676 RepID=UPI0036C68BD5
MGRLRWGAPRAGSIVPVWRPALTADVLAVDYQQILAALAERRTKEDGVMTGQEIAVVLGWSCARPAWKGYGRR